jgi:hypothetical protein
VKFLLFKLPLPALLTALMLSYSHFFEKPHQIHRQVFATMTSEAQVQKAEHYMDHYYFLMSYVDCGAAFETKGHANNCKYLIQAMKAVHDCEKAGIPIDRQALVLDNIDDFQDDLTACQNPNSQATKLGIDPWERFR